MLPLDGALLLRQMEGAGEEGVHVPDGHGLLRLDAPSAEELGDGHAEELRQGLEQGDVRQAQSPLPLAHRLVGYV